MLKNQHRKNWFQNKEIKEKYQGNYHHYLEEIYNGLPKENVKI